MTGRKGSSTNARHVRIGVDTGVVITGNERPFTVSDKLTPMREMPLTCPSRDRKLHKPYGASEDSLK